MKPAPFTYHRPTTIAEAVDLLAELAPADGRIIAGGQSLVPIMAFRMARPAHLIDINAIDDLNSLSVGPDALVVGATVRHAAFERPVIDNGFGRLLARVAGHIGHFPVRTRGTFCGSLAHADPASEWALVCVVLGGTIMLRSSAGARAMPAADYFEGAMVTTRADDELIVEARLPLPPSDIRFGFNEFSRRAGDFGLAIALACGRIEDGVILDPRIGIGGAEERPRRIDVAEAVLAGREATSEVLCEAADAAVAAVEPMDDGRLAVGYRRDLVRAVTRRALEEAFA
jgi:carbon-monoxide dehydrogenase medium subunit